MKKTFLLIPFFLVLFQDSKAQSRDDKEFMDAQGNTISFDSKVFLGARIGPTIPLGDFGEIDINNEDAGLAKTGIQLNVNIQYLFTESFYGIIELGYSSNPFDENELLLPVQNSVPSNVQVSASSSGWNGKTINAGVGTRTIIDPKTYFLTKFALGLQNMETPGYSISLTDGRTTQVIRQSSSTSDNLNLNLGASIITELNSTTFFFIGLDYVRSEHDFENIIITNTVNGANAGAPLLTEFSQSIEMVSATIGINIKI